MLLTPNFTLTSYPVFSIKTESAKLLNFNRCCSGKLLCVFQSDKKIAKKLIRREIKRIETQMHPIVKKTERYQLEIGYVDQESKIYTEINRSEKLSNSLRTTQPKLPRNTKILPSFERYNNQQNILNFM